MSQLFLTPFVPALGLTGLPADAATLTFYLTGTTTLATIRNAAGVALSNPLTADAFGRFPSIYLDESSVYRVVLKTKLGATLGDVDPLTPGSSVSLPIEQFGGGTAVSDNTTAFRNAMTTFAALGGGVLQLGAGTYNLASATLAGAGIEVAPNTTIRGAGKNATRLVVTGATNCYLFFNEGNKSDQVFCDLTAVGNGLANNNGIGSFYYCSLLTGSGTADVKGCVVRNVRLDNFGGDQWVMFFCTHPTYTISKCGLDWGCEAITRTGNSRDPNNIGVRSDIVSFRGDGGALNDCFVNGLDGELAYAKVGIAAFGRVNRLRIRTPNLRNTFTGYNVSDKGSYAILLYSLSAADTPTDTLIDAPIITSVVSCGIYCAEARQVQINSPRISGQTDTADGTIPKGAIALNGCNDVRVIGADLTNNVWNFSISGVQSGSYDADMRIAIIGGRGRNATQHGIKIKASSIVSLCGGIRFDGYVDTNSAEGAVALFPATGFGLSDVTFTSFDFASAKHAVNLNASAIATNTSAGIAFRSGRISATGSTFYGFLGSGAMAGALTIDRVRFDNTAANHISLGASTSVTIVANVFAGAVSAANMDLPGAQGVLRDNAAPNGSTLVTTGATQLGRNLPTWAGGPGQSVQNAAQGLTGTTPNAYRLHGWVWTTGTTWAEDRSGLV